MFSSNYLRILISIEECVLKDSSRVYHLMESNILESEILEIKC